MREIVLLVNSSGTGEALTNLLLKAGFDVRSVVGTDVASSLIDSTMLGAILVSLDHAEVSQIGRAHV